MASCSATRYVNAPRLRLRHTYATLLLSQGVTLARIAVLMGHSDARVTALYGHLVGDDHVLARTVLSAAAAGILTADEAEDEDAV